MFGLDCVVVPCPVTGAPLVVPATLTSRADTVRARTTGPPDAEQNDVTLVHLLLARRRLAAAGPGVG